MSDHASPVPSKRRKDVVFGVAATAAVLVLAWVVVTMQHLSHDLRTSNAARDALAQQVQGLGASPVAGPPGSRGEPGPAVVGPSGPPGATGPSGTPGSPGPSGSPGPTGKTGSTGPSGTPGASVTGPAGTDGQGGVQGDPGPAGVQGDPGPAGPAGTDGRDGAPGQPPAGWSYTDPSGVAYTCSPAAGFDPAAPRYTCAADAVASPTPSGSTNTSGLLGVGLLAATATYRRL